VRKIWTFLPINSQEYQDLDTPPRSSSSPPSREEQLIAFLSKSQEELDHRQKKSKEIKKYPFSSSRNRVVILSKKKKKAKRGSNNHVMDDIRNMPSLSKDNTEGEQHLMEEEIIEVGLEDGSSMVEDENSVNKKKKGKKSNKKRKIRAPSSTTETKEESEYRFKNENFKDDGERRFNNVGKPIRSKRTKRQRSSNQSESFDEIFQMVEEVEIVPEVIGLLNDDETHKRNEGRRKRGKMGQQDPVKWVIKRLGVTRYSEVDINTLVDLCDDFMMSEEEIKSQKMVLEDAKESNEEGEMEEEKESLYIIAEGGSIETINVDDQFAIEDEARGSRISNRHNQLSLNYGHPSIQTTLNDFPFPSSSSSSSSSISFRREVITHQYPPLKESPITKKARRSKRGTLNNNKPIDLFTSSIDRNGSDNNTLPYLPILLIMGEDQCP